MFSKNTMTFSRLKQDRLLHTQCVCFILALMALPFVSSTALSTSSSSEQSSCNNLPYSLSYPIHPDCGPQSYCSSTSLKCLLLNQHPKWGLNCSRNVVKSSMVCGETTLVGNTDPLLVYQQLVLQCIHHHCYQCEEGTRNFTSGMICVGNMWIFERSNSIIDNYYDLVLSRDATSIVLIITMVLFVGLTIFGMVLDIATICKRKRSISETEMEMANDKEFMEYYENIMEKERSKRAKKLKKRMKALQGDVGISSEEENESDNETNEEDHNNGNGEDQVSDGNQAGQSPATRPLPMTPLQQRHLQALKDLTNKKEGVEQLAASNTPKSIRDNTNSRSNLNNSSRIPQSNVNRPQPPTPPSQQEPQVPNRPRNASPLPLRRALPTHPPSKSKSNSHSKDEY